MSRRNSPSVNSGSMADIAFLLLIFFLLTTTISAEKGILRTIPNDCLTIDNCQLPIKENNVLRIKTNASSELMIDEELVDIENLSKTLKSFIDNNANGTCNYCSGSGELNNSDHPTKAYISLTIHAETKYDFYIQIQDEISKAYFELRSSYAQNNFYKTPENLTKEEIIQLREAYPFNLVEANNSK